MEDYYPDEIGEIIAAWNDLHKPDRDRVEEADAVTFLGDGGERL